MSTLSDKIRDIKRHLEYRKIGIQYKLDKANFRINGIEHHRIKHLNKNPKFEDVLEKLNEDGMLLRCITDNEKNKTMCLTAVKQNIDAVSFIPTLLLLEIYDNEVRKVNKKNLLLERIFEEVENREGKKNIGMMIDELGVRNRFYSYAMDKESYTEHKTVFNRLNHTLFSYDDVLFYLYSDGLLLGQISPHIINKKMCVIAIFQNKKSVQFIPKRLIWQVRLYLCDLHYYYMEEGLSKKQAHIALGLRKANEKYVENLKHEVEEFWYSNMIMQ